MRLALSLLVLLLGTTVLAKISVYHPKELKDSIGDKGIDYTIARIGNIPYGQALTGTVFLAEPRTACGPINIGNPESEDHEPSPIVLAELGNCRAVTKARYAQMAGAKVLILVSNADHIDDKAHRDYGNNHDVNIPIIIIGRVAGGKIIQVLEKNEKVQLMIHFPKESPSEIINKVDIDFWYTSSDITNSAYNFLHNFHQTYSELKDYINFNPHPVLWLCGRCRLGGWSKAEANCLSGGRFCSPDPDNSGPRHGSEVVLEDLKQLCIWRDSPDKWWSYTEAYANCKGDNDQTACRDSALKAAGIEDSARSKLDQCVESSFVADGNNKVDYNLNDNQILQVERNYQVENNIQHFPSLAINHILFNGRLQNTNLVKERICEGLKTKPSTCQNLVYTEDDNSMSAHSAKIALIIAVMVVVMCILLYVSRRAARRELASEMPEKINEAIAEYFALKDTSRSDDV